MDCITSKYAMILVVCGVLMYFKSRVKQTLQGVNFSHYLAIFRGKSPSPSPAKGNNDYAPLHDLENPSPSPSPSPSPAPVHAPAPQPAFDSGEEYYADALKNSRFVWSVELHHKFVEIVNQLGLNRATPSKILEMMNDTNVTKVQVAVQLQKYRFYIKKKLASKDLWPEESQLKFVDAVNQLGLDNATPEKVLELMNVENITRENMASHLEKYSLYMKRFRVLSNQLASMNKALRSPLICSINGSTQFAQNNPWTEELHLKFVEAVNQLGLKNALTDQIMELMSDGRLTRDNVAIHLQNYRQYMDRICTIVSRQANLATMAEAGRGPASHSYSLVDNLPIQFLKLSPLFRNTPDRSMGNYTVNIGGSLI